MANHLIESNSLYLRKHINNPINWWYWSDEALEQAEQEDKPIFLSIGYSSCHWCTVMEGEAFSDLSIAEYLNANFIAIKVDREERPDLDSIYMQALQMMIGQGGWPLNIFLTPGDLVPFYGGTYFSVEPRYNRPSFIDILKAIYRYYKVEKEKLQLFKTEITENIAKSALLALSEAESLTKALLIKGVDRNTAVISANAIGQPCFPMIPYAKVALQGKKLQEQLNYNATQIASQIASQRGLDLVLGGIYDHVGGGFHRYTVDATWTVPHFEKMLYDNGQILEYLADLWSSGWQQPSLAIAIAGTVEWLVREIRSNRGYFYAAQDADSFATIQDLEPEEGLFYVWSYQELASLLTSAELAILQAEFSITPQGNFEGNNVLQRLKEGELASDLVAILDRLFTVRYGESRQKVNPFAPAKNNQEALQNNWKGRIPPVTDTKMIVAWNSLMISGLARAYAVFQETQYKELAVDAVNFIWQQQRQANHLYRLNYDGKVAVFAQSEDYAFLIKALLDLQTVCPEEDRWLEYALELQTEFDLLFWNQELGGYYNNASDYDRHLLVKEISYIDNATPSANGIALTNLMRLALLTDSLAYRDRAERGLRAFAVIMEQSPQACPSLFVALDWFLHGTVVKTTTEYLTQLIPEYYPTTVYRLHEDLPEKTIALVCNSVSCLEPAIDLEVLKQQINRFSS
jgi:uncharacterized protein